MLVRGMVMVLNDLNYKISTGFLCFVVGLCSWNDWKLNIEFEVNC